MFGLFRPYDEYIHSGKILIKYSNDKYHKEYFVAVDQLNNSYAFVNGKEALKAKMDNYVQKALEFGFWDSTGVLISPKEIDEISRTFDKPEKV